MTRDHLHQCGVCRHSFVCDGDLSRNHDGWPAVLCSEVSRYDDLLVCDTCLAAQDAACERERHEEWAADVLLGIDA